MAAHYSTGTAASPNAMLQVISAVLTTQGWTIDSDTTDGSGRRLHAHKGGVYVNLRSAMAEAIWNGVDSGNAGYGIGLYLGTGYSGASAWHSQAGAPMDTATVPKTTGCGMNMNSGAISSYHIFDDGLDNIVVVVEKSPGVFVHLGWGPGLVKGPVTADFIYSGSLWYFFGSTPAYRNTEASGSYPFETLPGLQITAVAPMAHSHLENSNTEWYATGFFKVPSAIFSGLWVGTAADDDSNKRTGYTGRKGRSALNRSASSSLPEGNGKFIHMKSIADRNHQTSFPGALLDSIHLFVENGTTARWMPVGYPPTVFYSTAFTSAGFGAASVYQVGGLDYMVFPGFVVRKAA